MGMTAIPRDTIIRYEVRLCTTTVLRNGMRRQCNKTTETDHNSIYNVAVGGAQGVGSLGAGDTSLGSNQLNDVGLKTSLINRLVGASSVGGLSAETCQRVSGWGQSKKDARARRLRRGGGGGGGSSVLELLGSINL